MIYSGYFFLFMDGCILSSGCILLVMNFANLKNVSLLRFWGIYRFAIKRRVWYGDFFCIVHRNNLSKAKIFWMVTSYSSKNLVEKHNTRYWNCDRSRSILVTVAVPKRWFIVVESKSWKTLPVCNCPSVLLSVAFVFACHSQWRPTKKEKKFNAIKIWR